jgi:tRNA threonylcarbamoyl adenosine modification protein YeaZ
LWRFFVPKSEKPYILAVETSGRVGSVAVGQGDTILYESAFSGFMKHGAELIGSLAGLLDRAGICPCEVGHLYITAGPGSFTGIRIAVTLAKMLSFAVGTRIVAVDTLDAMAENAAEYLKATNSDLTRVATILDAKQNRFFVSLYERQGDDWAKLLPDSLLGPEDVLGLINKDHIAVGLLGEGLVYYADKFACPLTQLIDKAYWPATARGVYAVGQRMAKQNQFSDIYSLVPTYIRKPDAVEKRKKTT